MLNGTVRLLGSAFLFVALFVRADAVVNCQASGCPWIDQNLHAFPRFMACGAARVAQR